MGSECNQCQYRLLTQEGLPVSKKPQVGTGAGRKIGFFPNGRRNTL